MTTHKGRFGFTNIWQFQNNFQIGYGSFGTEHFLRDSLDSLEWMAVNTKPKKVNINIKLETFLSLKYALQNIAVLGGIIYLIFSYYFPLS